MRSDTNILWGRQGLQTDNRAGVVVVAYLAVLATSELLSIVAGLTPALVIHALLIPLLLSHYVVAQQAAYRRVLPVIALAPLLRILSFTLPSADMPRIYWYVAIGAPVLLSVILTARLLDVSWVDLGLTMPSWRQQVLVGLSGVPLSIAAFLILRPDVIVARATLLSIVGAILILVVFTGFVEELLFRGLLLQVGLQAFGSVGRLYASLLFVTMYIGSMSLNYLVFIGVTGWFFSWCVIRTRSLWGVICAHSLISVGLLIVWPLVTHDSEYGIAVIRFSGYTIAFVLTIVAAGSALWSRINRGHVSSVSSANDTLEDEQPGTVNEQAGDSRNRKQQRKAFVSFVFTLIFTIVLGSTMLRYSGAGWDSLGNALWNIVFPSELTNRPAAIPQAAFLPQATTTTVPEVVQPSIATDAGRSVVPPTNNTPVPSPSNPASAVAPVTAVPSNTSSSVSVPQLPTTLSTKSALAKGSKGEQVERLQRRLQELNYFQLEITGFFGDKTVAAVKRFQTHHKLRSSGVADYATIKTLNTCDASCAAD